MIAVPQRHLAVWNALSGSTEDKFDLLFNTYSDSQHFFEYINTELTHLGNLPDPPEEPPNLVDDIPHPLLPDTNPVELEPDVIMVGLEEV